MSDGADPKVSELPARRAWDVRGALALAGGLLLLIQYALYELLIADGSSYSYLIAICAEALLIRLFLVQWRAWRELPHRSITFDSDGLWLSHLGKERGLVRWSAISRIKENSFNNWLSLHGSNGALLLRVEYDRKEFGQIRSLLLAFSLRYVVIPLFLLGIPLFSWLAFARVGPVIGRDGLTIGSRKYSYADVESVSAFLVNSRGYMSPRLQLNFSAPRSPVQFGPAGSDSLTVQRILQGALEDWRASHLSG